MLFNRARAEAVMAARGIDALVATSPDNVMYATDYVCVSHWLNKGFQVYSVFTPQHAPAASLIAPSLELEPLVESRSWVDDIYLFAHFERGPAQANEMDAVGREAKAITDRAHVVRRAMDGLIAALEARGLTRGRLAVDESGMSPLHWFDLQQRLPNAELIPASALWWEVRMVKTQDEQARLRRASAVTEKAVNAAFRMLRPGIAESELARRFEEVLVAEGTRPAFCIIGSGSRSSYTHSLRSDRRVEAGDLVRYDVGCMADYYYSDTARAVVLGKPGGAQQRIWDALSQGVEEAIARIRPGADPADLFEAAMGPGRKLGLAGFDRFHCGHGIGISVYDPPVVTRADPTQSAFLMPRAEGGLLPGMSLNIEVGYYVQGVQGYLCEDTMLVTEQGCERLTHNSKALAFEDWLRELPTAG